MPKLVRSRRLNCVAGDWAAAGWLPSQGEGHLVERVWVLEALETCSTKTEGDVIGGDPALYSSSTLAGASLRESPLLTLETTALTGLSQITATIPLSRYQTVRTA